jgi:hypothetical protein
LLIISLGGFSLPRKLILGSIKYVRGSPQGLAKKSSPTCRGDVLIISLGGFSLPRKLILGIFFLFRRLRRALFFNFCGACSGLCFFVLNFRRLRRALFVQLFRRLRRALVSLSLNYLI